MSPGHLFLVLAMTTGVVLVFLTPPFQVADELCHSLRISSYLEGHPLPVRGPDGVYVLKVSSQILGDGGRLIGQTPFHPERRYDFALVRQALARPARDSASAVTPHCPNTSLYSPVSYVPQMVGMGAASLAKTSTPIRLWAGRLTNLCFFVCVTFLAIGVLSSHQDLLLALALMPMTLFQAASLSPDSALNALSFLFIAYTVRLLSSTSVNSGQVGMLVLVGMAMAMIKAAYLPLTASIWLLVPATFRAWRQGGKVRPLLLVLVLPVCAFVASWLWLSSISPYYDPVLWKPDVDAELQRQWIAAHPAAVLRRLAISLVHTHEYFGQFVGLLGWTDTPIPLAWRIAYGTLLALLAFGRIRGSADGTGPVLPGLTARLVFVALAVACLLLAFLAMVVTFEKVGDDGPIMGIQGRYLIPAALPVLLAMELPARWRRVVSIPRTVLVGALVFSQIVLLWTVWKRYYGA
jgi:uncharacterized membrane protein